MTFDEKVGHIENLVKNYKDMEKQFDAIDELFGNSYESALGNAVWCAFDSYTNSVAALIGDKADWLEWFIFDADCGNNPLEASLGDIKILADSPEKLLEIIAL